MMQAPEFEVSTLVERMSHLPHFNMLSKADLAHIVRFGAIRTYPTDKIIFHEEDPCAGLFILLKGQVFLYKNGPEGQENTLAVINPVIMFNEVAALDGGPNPVTARTSQECTLWHVRCEGWEKLLSRYPTLAVGLLHVLAARNRFMISQYEDLSFRPVRSRLAKLLLDLSGNGKEIIDRRQNTINAMASRISTVPEAVSRTLGEFNRNGLVVSTRMSISIQQPDELAQLAQIGLELY